MKELLGMARAFNECLWSQREAISVIFDLTAKQPCINHPLPYAGLFIALGN